MKPEFSPLSVMIVDDAGVVRLACERALARAGFQVRIAENGPAALDQLQSAGARAILLDLKMPKMTGLELLRVLRSGWPDTEVIVMTAYADSPMIEEAKKLGAMAVMLKPFDDIKKVIKTTAQAVIRSLLRRRLSLDEEALLRPVLVEPGWITEPEFNSAKPIAQAKGISLRAALLDSGVISADQLEWAVASFLDVPYVHLDLKMLDPELLSQFPLELAKKLACLPLFIEDGAVHVVADNPFDRELEDRVGAHFQRPLVLYKGHGAEIMAAAARLSEDVHFLLSGAELAARLNSRGGADPSALIASLFQKASIHSLEKSRLTLLASGDYAFNFAGTLSVSAPTGQRPGSAPLPKTPDKIRNVR